MDQNYQSIFDMDFSWHFVQSLPFAVTKPWEVPEEETSDENNDDQRSVNRDQRLQEKASGLQPRTTDASRKTLETFKRALRDCENAVRRTDGTLEELKKAVGQSHRTLSEALRLRWDCETAIEIMSDAVVVWKVALNEENGAEVDARNAEKRTLEAQNNLETTLMELESVFEQALRALDQSLKFATELEKAMEAICYPRGTPPEYHEDSLDSQPLRLETTKRYLDKAVPLLRKVIEDGHATGRSHAYKKTDETQTDAYSSREALENAEGALRLIVARTTDLRGLTGPGISEMIEMFRLCKNCDFFRGRMGKQKFYLERFEEELEGSWDEKSERLEESKNS